MVGVGLLMLLLTSLQGWGMVAVIASQGEVQSPFIVELKRLHNLGLTGGLLAVAVGLTMMVLPLAGNRPATICRILLPSFVIAPVAFCDRVLAVVVGAANPPALQGAFFALQAVSALGITVGLGMLTYLVFTHRTETSPR